MPSIPNNLCTQGSNNSEGLHCTEPRKPSQPSHPSPNEDTCHDKGNLQDLCEKCWNCWEFCSDHRQWCVSRSHNMLNVRFTHPLCVARSTKLMLRTSPSLYAPTLQNNHVKQDIIRMVKKESYPYGTDVPGTRSRSFQRFVLCWSTYVLGVIHLMNEDLEKPLKERYIHGFTSTSNGGRVILTANQFLLTRIHLAKTIYVDTTFKRTLGTLKEWEVVMYNKEVECGMELHFFALNNCYSCQKLSPLLVYIVIGQIGSSTRQSLMSFST